MYPDGCKQILFLSLMNSTTTSPFRLREGCGFIILYTGKVGRQERTKNEGAWSGKKIREPARCR